MPSAELTDSCQSIRKGQSCIDNYITVIIIAVILAVSVGLNLYHYGYQYVFQKGFNAGTIAVSNAVVQQYKDTGKIQMQFENKAIVFIPENISIGASSLSKNTTGSASMPLGKQVDVDKMFQ